MNSLGAMIKRINGLTGTSDVTRWENHFIESIVRQTGNGHDTQRLSDAQIEHVTRIHMRNFGDAEG